MLVRLVEKSQRKLLGIQGCAALYFATCVEHKTITLSIIQLLMYLD